MEAMNAEFYEALALLEEEKGIPKEYMFDKIKAAIAAAVKRDKGVNPEMVDVVFDEKKQTIRVFAKKLVVEEVENESDEISLEDAQQISKRYAVGDFVEFDYDPSAVGRIAAKVGKNVIVQAINEAVNGSLIQEFEERKGKLVTGVVKRIETNRNVYLEIGKYELPLNVRGQIPGEEFEEGDRVRVCVSDIRKGTKSQEIVLSRSNSEFVKCLFELEVPEIADETVKIYSISREAGSRTKVAVYSDDPNVDAVGACIGSSQTRIKAILSNLNGERIDLIKYHENPAEFIAASLSPAEVEVLEISVDERTCRVLVDADKLSLAIGKTGQNVRLAARLTGYKIDILSK